MLGILWNFWAANTPAEWRGPPRMKPEERVLFGLKPDGASSPAAQDETGDKGKARSLALATYFFRVPRAYLPMLGHTIIVRAIPSALHPKYN